RALSVSEVVLSDPLSNRNHNTLPSDHRPEAQSQRDRDLYPGRNEFGSEVDVVLVIPENFLFVRTEFRFARFLHETQGFTDNVHIIAKIAHPFRRNVAERFEFFDFATNLINVLPQSEHRIVVELSTPDIVRQVVPRVSYDCRALDM